MLIPCVTRRPNVAPQFGLAPPILVAGRIVDFTTEDPVVGAGVHRNVLFTTIIGSSGLTDPAGRFELQIH